MPGRRQILRGALWIAAVCFWGITFLLANAAFPACLRLANKAHYLDAVFHVTGAGVTGRYGSQPFLEGRVNGHREVYVDTSAPRMSWPEYLKIFPIGTAIPIKYNAQTTGILLANQSLRVLKRDWNFEEDGWLIRYYLLGCVVPSVCIGVALYITRKKAPRGA